MLRGLLLDLDDTLYDRGVAFAAWAAALAHGQLGRGLEPAELVALRAFDRRGHRSRVAFARDVRALGLEVDAGAFPFELSRYVVPEPGVTETLAALARTHRIAIVTNGGAAQRVKLARLGLDEIVRHVFVSGELGVAKPEPAILERAVRWLELPATEVVFVGDHPEIDLAPAAALGMATAWRMRSEWPAGLPPPTYRLASIGDLARVCA